MTCTTRQLCTEYGRSLGTKGVLWSWCLSCPIYIVSHSGHRTHQIQSLNWAHKQVSLLVNHRWSQSPQVCNLQRVSETLGRLAEMHTVDLARWISRQQCLRHRCGDLGSILRTHIKVKGDTDSRVVLWSSHTCCSTGAPTHVCTHISYQGVSDLVSAQLWEAMFPAHSQMVLPFAQGLRVNIFKLKKVRLMPRMWLPQ